MCVVWAVVISVKTPEQLEIFVGIFCVNNRTEFHDQSFGKVIRAWWGLGGRETGGGNRERVAAVGICKSFLSVLHHSSVYCAFCFRSHCCCVDLARLSSSLFF